MFPRLPDEAGIALCDVGPVADLLAVAVVEAGAAALPYRHAVHALVEGGAVPRVRRVRGAIAAHT
jgi:hypothetical protein